VWGTIGGSSFKDNIRFNIKTFHAEQSKPRYISDHNIGSGLNFKTMRYLITTNGQEPFLTKWFDSENHFNKDIGMVVYDLGKNRYTTDGKNWYDIKFDHL